jgi:hypothetical protein
MTRFLAIAAPVVALLFWVDATPASGATMGWWTKDPMNGAIEVPVNNSAGTGVAFVDYDDSTHLMRFRATWSGLTGTTTVSHIHASAGITPFSATETAGVATPTPTFPGFPAGVTAGSYDTTLDLTQASSWNGAFVTANSGTPASAEAAFIGMMDTGRAYWNIHTSFAGGGEIRGYFHTPEPGAVSLLGGAAVVAIIRRRRRAV